MYLAVLLRFNCRCVALLYAMIVFGKENICFKFRVDVPENTNPIFGLMKTKHGFLLLVLGYCFDFVGAYLKITHKANADNIFLIATGLKIIGALFILYKLVIYRKFRDFMNS